MKSTLKLIVGATCAAATMAASSVAVAAPANTSAPVLIDIVSDMPFNGYRMLGPFNVSKYSEISILAYATSTALDSGMIPIFSATPTPVVYTENSTSLLDLKSAGSLAGICMFSSAGLFSCSALTSTSAIGSEISSNFLVSAPYVSFLVQATSTVTMKLWAKP